MADTTFLFTSGKWWGLLHRRAGRGAARRAGHWVIAAACGQANARGAKAAPPTAAAGAAAAPRWLARPGAPSPWRGLMLLT